MGILKYQTFRVFVAQELEKITEPTGMVRRVGVSEYATEVRHSIQKDLDAVDSLISEGHLSLEKATKSVTDLVLEMTSFLYAVGAEHLVWRRWSSLTSLGMFLTGKIQQAAQYAALGGEWDFLKVLPDVPVRSEQISEQVLWMLVKDKPIPSLGESASDDEDHAWLQLANSIPAQDHRKTEDALKLLAEFWMAEDDGDWLHFHPRSSPDFETPVCAVAAIARHHGFIPTSLTPEQYRFLEPGLASSEPPPLFPNYFSLPASQKELAS